MRPTFAVSCVSSLDTRYSQTLVVNVTLNLFLSRTRLEYVQSKERWEAAWKALRERPVSPRHAHEYTRTSSLYFEFESSDLTQKYTGLDEDGQLSRVGNLHASQLRVGKVWPPYCRFVLLVLW